MAPETTLAPEINNNFRCHMDISAIENDRVEIGKHRAIALAETLNVHPSSIMFADYDLKVS